MAKYVDGFLLPLPRKNLDAYRRLSRAAAKIFREHGAIEYRECVGDDLKAKGMVPFPKRTGTKPSEVVVFSWVVYRSKKSRDRANAKIMADPRLHKLMERYGMPFDMKRMSMGGFEVLVDA
jgi:uncharacterized protein YbaA (DUF1428 family)